MTKKQAEQISDLLFERNKLKARVPPEDILNLAENYCLVLDDGGDVIACAQVLQVQWYQWELLHVSVLTEKEGLGFANRAAQAAEELAISKGAQILQCTIREDNERSWKLFERNDFKRVNQFYNAESGRWLFIYQKILSKSPKQA